MKWLWRQVFQSKIIFKIGLLFFKFHFNLSRNIKISPFRIISLFIEGSVGGSFESSIRKLDELNKGQNLYLS